MSHGGGDFFAQGNRSDSNTSRDGRVGVNHNVTLGGCDGPSRCIENDGATTLGFYCTPYWWELKDPLCCSVFRGVGPLCNVDLANGSEVRYGYEAAFILDCSDAVAEQSSTGGEVVFFLDLCERVSHRSSF